MLWQAYLHCHSQYGSGYRGASLIAIGKGNCLESQGSKPFPEPTLRNLCNAVWQIKATMN